MIAQIFLDVQDSERHEVQTIFGAIECDHRLMPLSGEWQFNARGYVSGRR